MTTSRLSIVKEPDKKATNPVDKTEETTAPDKEATKLNQEAKEEIPALEATATGRQILLLLQTPGTPTRRMPEANQGE